jgi:hypothetical protein
MEKNSRKFIKIFKFKLILNESKSIYKTLSKVKFIFIFILKFSQSQKIEWMSEGPIFLVLQTGQILFLLLKVSSMHSLQSIWKHFVTITSLLRSLQTLHFTIV